MSSESNALASSNFIPANSSYIPLTNDPPKYQPQVRGEAIDWDAPVPIDSFRHTFRNKMRQKAHVIALVILGILFIGAIAALIGSGIGAGVGGLALIAATVSISSFAIGGAGVGGGIGILFAVAWMGYLAYKNHRKRVLERAIPSLGLDPVKKGFVSLDEFSNNSVIVTKHAKETAKLRLAMIDRAEQSIEICGSYCGGKIFTKTLERIEARIEATKVNGVSPLKVHFIGQNNFFTKAHRKKINELKKRFPDNFKFLTVKEYLGWANHLAVDIIHEKMLIVDGKWFAVGGTSTHDPLVTKGDEAVPRAKGKFVEKTLCTSSRDMDIVGSGPAAPGMRCKFFERYALWSALMSRCAKSSLKEHNRYFDLDDAKPKAYIPEIDEHKRIVRDAPMRTVFSGPSDEFNRASLEYIRLLRAAKKEVRIANLFFDPVSDVKKEIQAAVDDGVKLRVITNGVRKDSPWSNRFFGWASRANYWNLSVKKEDRRKRPEKIASENLPSTSIREHAVPHGIIHEKVMTVSLEGGKDGEKCYALVGSANLGHNSHESDGEMVLVFDSKEVVEQINARLDKDEKLSEEVLLKTSWEYAKRPKYRLYSWFNRFVAPIGA